MPNNNRVPIWLLTGAAMIALSVTDAQATTQKEQELEARVIALEKAFGMLQGELQTTKAENAQLRDAVAETKATSVQAVKAIEEARPVLAAAKQACIPPAKTPCGSVSAAMVTIGEPCETPPPTTG